MHPGEQDLLHKEYCIDSVVIGERFQQTVIKTFAMCSVTSLITVSIQQINQVI